MFSKSGVPKPWPTGNLWPISSQRKWPVRPQYLIWLTSFIVLEFGLWKLRIILHNYYYFINILIPCASIWFLIVIIWIRTNNGIAQILEFYKVVARLSAKNSRLLEMLGNSKQKKAVDNIDYNQQTWHHREIAQRKYLKTIVKIESTHVNFECGLRVVKKMYDILDWLWWLVSSHWWHVSCRWPVAGQTKHTNINIKNPNAMHLKYKTSVKMLCILLLTYCPT